MLVDFYHLTEAPLERVLPSICEKVLATGERLLIVAEPDLLGHLDAQLWAYAPDSFLPHGQGNAADQPILLSDQVEAANGAANVALADGRWREEALSFAASSFSSTKLRATRRGKIGPRSRTAKALSGATGSRTSGESGCSRLKRAACGRGRRRLESRANLPHNMEPFRPWRPNAPSRSSSPMRPVAI